MGIPADVDGRLEMIAMTLMDDRSCCLGQSGDRSQVTGSQPRIEQQADRSETEHPEQCGDVLEPVRHDQQHPVAGFDAIVSEQGGESGGGPIHFCIRHIPIVETERHPVAVPLRQTLPQQVIVDVEAVRPAPGHIWKLQGVRRMPALSDRTDRAAPDDGFSSTTRR